MSREAVRTSVKKLKETEGLIKKEGWIQGRDYAPGQGYCLRGAMKATSAWSDGEARLVVVREVRRVEVGREGADYQITHWNDDVARGKQDVIKLLRKARRKLRWRRLLLLGR